MQFGIGLKRGKFGVYVDTGELEAAIDRTEEKGKQITNQDVRDIALEFIHKVEQKTPVKTGRARSGWYRAVVGLGGSWSDRGSDPAMISLGKSEGNLIDRTDRKYNREIIIENNVPYIMSLERGWSKQAPAGMVALTTLEMQGKLKKTVLEGYRLAWYGKGKNRHMRIFRGAQSGRSNISMPAF